MKKLATPNRFAGAACLLLAMAPALIARDFIEHLVAAKPASLEQSIYFDGQQSAEWQAWGLALAFTVATMGFIAAGVVLLRSKKVQAIPLPPDDV